MRSLIAAAAILISTAAGAQEWRDAASPFDLERLDGAGAQLRRAVDEARARGTPEDVAALDGVLGTAQPIDGEALLGDWRCRTMKLGGLGGLVVYGWFQCRISYGAEGLWFEKLTGSQQTAGYLWPNRTGDEPLTSFIYLGSAHYRDEEPAPYGGPGNTLGDSRENRDDPGILEVLGPDHVRIGFPSPIFESDYDFLELRR